MPNGKTWARILAAGALAVLLLALGWAVANGLDEDDAASQAPATRETAVTTTRPKPTTRPVARARFVKLTAAGAFDPEVINDAFRAMKAGEVARTVLTFD